MSSPAHKRLPSATIIVTLAALLLPVQLPAQLQVEGVTSQAREIQYANEAEQSPLGATSSTKRAAALLYVENDHTHHVVICGPFFQQMLANRQHFANEINSQMLISSAAYLYGHPESSGDARAQTLAGLRAALVVYEKVLNTDSGARSPVLDHLLELRLAGKLEQALPESCKVPGKS